MDDRKRRDLVLAVRSIVDLAKRRDAYERQVEEKLDVMNALREMAETPLLGRDLIERYKAEIEAKYAYLKTADLEDFDYDNMPERNRLFSWLGIAGVVFTVITVATVIMSFSMSGKLWLIPVLCAAASVCCYIFSDRYSYEAQVKRYYRECAYQRERIQDKSERKFREMCGRELKARVDELKAANTEVEVAKAELELSQGERMAEIEEMQARLDTYTEKLNAMYDKFGIPEKSRNIESMEYLLSRLENPEAEKVGK